MVWNRTPQEKVDGIVNVIRTTDKLDYEIAEDFNVSAWLVGEISRKNLTVEERKEIWSKRARRSKLGNDNPMYGKTGNLHHNSVKVSRCNGYKTVFKPDWWGTEIKDSRIYEHVYVYCVHNNMKCLPNGYIVHHIDGDINNNDITNLQMLTISEHIKLHWQQRKEQRLSERSRE
jgi:hypothetical protein